RIGRTARAGAEGTAIAFCAPAEMEELQAIEKLLKNKIPVLGGAPWAMDMSPAKKPQGRGGYMGGRPGYAKPGRSGQVQKSSGGRSFAASSDAGAVTLAADRPAARPAKTKYVGGRPS
ncbi:MAG: ATP-dependent helicase, partial [Paracoccaceae bacterium]